MQKKEIRYTLLRFITLSLVTKYICFIYVHNFSALKTNSGHLLACGKRMSCSFLVFHMQIFKSLDLYTLCRMEEKLITEGEENGDTWTKDRNTQLRVVLTHFDFRQSVVTMVSIDTMSSLCACSRMTSLRAFTNQLPAPDSFQARLPAHGQTSVIIIVIYMYTLLFKASVHFV